MFRTTHAEGAVRHGGTAHATGLLAVAAVVLVALGAALVGLVGPPLPLSTLLLQVAPGAVAAVGAGRVGSGRAPGATGAWLAGLAAAAATVGVGGWAAVSTAWATGVPVASVLAPLPAHAASSLLVVAALAGLGWRLDVLHPRRAVVALRRGRRALVAGATALPLALAIVVVPTAGPAAAAAVEDPAVRPCVAGEQVRNYAVSAISVDVPFNRWGKTLTGARIFALDQDVAAIQNWHRPLATRAADDPAQNRRLRPRPLVLRANEGECIRVTLTNRLSTSGTQGLPGDARVGIQAAGVVMNVRRSGGARVGYNADPTVGVGETISYFWKVPAQEGLFMFEDLATPAGGEHDAGSRGIGLYGALAVQPAGSTWTDPRSGKVLSGTPGALNSTYAAVRTQSGELYVEADIHPPGKPSFRESIQLAQDEVPGIGMGFNYGSEPLEDREALSCPDCVGEETWLSSWPYGDPALVKLASGKGPWLPNGTGDRKEKEDCGLPESCYVSNVFHAYNGDATKIRFGLAGVKETHVFHLHAHQWLADPREDGAQGEGPGYKPASSTIDSQSYGPGEAYTAELLYGAGSANGTFGDSIFHCHLYPHFAEGFWAIMRVHDVRLDGSSATPDGVNVRPLLPLPDVAPLPLPTADNPGFPGMIPGTYGYRAPQPPGAITEGGVDGTPERPAPRLVGGEQIATSKLAVEQKVIARHNGGGEAPRGAPFADPCPSGAREVDYAVTVLQRDLVYNTAGHHDPQARVMVLTKDVEAILAGTKKVEPLFVRVNAGDCINFSLTNMTHNWAGNDVFQKLVQTNMAGGHVHLTKFDVTASDGGSNGWNYQQAAFTKEQMDFTAKQASGAVKCTPSSTFYGGESTGCRIPYDYSWQPPADSRGLWGQTIHERWYADYELRTAFTHDHHFPAVTQNHGHYGALIVEPAGFDVRDPQTGRFKQPVNNPANGPVCGTRCEGDADGERADLVGPGANDDYREFGLAVADFVSLIRKGGDPRKAADAVNPPGAPEPYPSNDPGTFSVNYRNEPLHERRTRDGKPVDPAHQFSSWVFGDPYTPLLQAYARDNVKFRVIQGSHEEQHMFQVHGLRWREEPDDPDSPLVNAQTIGISEAFNVELPGYDCSATDVPCRGDYLYGATTPEGLWNGMWGVVRVHGQRTDALLPLPDNVPRTGTQVAPVPASRQAPPPAPTPGASCPATAPVKQFDVVAMAQKLVYNEHGDNDPKGAVYVLAEDEAAVRAGTKQPEPLVLRANVGDCVRVNLRNALPANYGDLVNGTDGDIRYTLEPPGGTRMGTRVSLHPQMLRHDVRLSDGAAVGFNRDSTAGINQTVAYEWFADQEVGATNLVDYGDVRGHRHHGLYAGLVIEPKDATYHHPVTGAEVRSGVAADIRVPGRRDFREHALFYEDGLDLRDTQGRAVVDTVHPGDAGEVPNGRENHGEKGVNYTNAPLHRRLGAVPGTQAKATSAAWSSVFSSAVWGDPRTPVIRAYEGDDLRIRLLNGSAKAPPAYFGNFQLDGASWRAEPYDAQTERVGIYGNLGSGGAKNVHVSLASPGDHLWASKTSLQLPSGVWGMARVYPRPATADAADFLPTPLRRNDNPYGADYAPLLPLERASVTVGVFDDANADGVRQADEAARAGAGVRLLATDGSVVATATTGTTGAATFAPVPGLYDVEVTAPTGTRLVGTALRRVDVRGDVAPARVAVGVTSALTLTARVFDDRDGNGVRGADEPAVAGRTVQLDGPLSVADGVTGTDGTASFPVVAGTWRAFLVARPGWSTTTPQPAVVTVSGAPATLDIGVRREPGVVVRVVDDVDGSGSADAGEPGVPGLTLDAVRADGTTVTALTTTDGAVVDTRRQDASARVLGPDARTWSCATVAVSLEDGTSTTVTCRDDGTFPLPADAVAAVVLGAFTDGVVSVQLFQDADSDGRRGPTEGALADWPVSLQDPVTHVEVARGTTAADGTTGFLVPPGDYEVVPLPPVADVAWTNTAAEYDITVERAARVRSTGGWVQRTSVSVTVYHDRDSNGLRDAYDEPLAERTVRLLDAAGKVRGTALTDSTGAVVFPVQAGSTYAVESTVPSGWRLTGPRSGSTVQTRVPVVAPANGAQAVVAFGHYNTVDRTPPARPVITPPGGALDRPALVNVGAETGAVIRYTLDGSTPTATRGMVFTADVRVATDRVFKAVAVDAAGNVSEVGAATFDLPWTGAVTKVNASAWQVTTGTARGQLSDSFVDDNRYLSTSSAPLPRQTVDTTARVVLPEGSRNPAALDVSISARTTLRGVRTRLQWWDNDGGVWRSLMPAYTSGLDEQRVDLDLPGAGRAVAADGTVLVRIIADVGQPFDLQVDQLTVTAVNRR